MVVRAIVVIVFVHSGQPRTATIVGSGAPTTALPEDAASEPAITRHDPHPAGTVSYFKNGVYGITADRSETHFRNVRFWTR